MKYFNPTEDVLDLQLTPHGKTLFALGKLNPKYYSFSDEDIIYDVKAAGTSLEEEQNSSNTRILEETPYVKPNPRKVSVVANDELMFSPQLTTDIQQAQQYSTSETKRDTLELYIETEATKAKSLGSMNYDTQNSPVFKMFIIAGDEIRSIDNVLSYVAEYDINNRKGHPDVRIPQINIDYVLKSTIVSPQIPEKMFSVDSTTGPSTDFNPGGNENSRVLTSSNELFFIIEEENVGVVNENFEIEVFEIKEEVDNDIASNIMKKLKFVKQYDDFQVSNDLLLSAQELSQKNDNLFKFKTSIDTEDRAEFVDYYLDLFTDSYDEISETVLCSYVSEIKARGLAKDISFECPDISPVDTDVYDFYNSDMGPPENC